MAGGDDDIPPLEDMSEVSEQIQGLKEASSYSSTSSSNLEMTTASPTVANGNASSTSSTNELLSSSKSAKYNNPKVSTQPVKYCSSSTGSFGGMKKGFLFGAPSKKTTFPGKTTASPAKSTQAADPNPVGGEDIPLIRPKKDDGDSKEKYQIDEVQEALKATAPLLQRKEWVTDDLLSNVEKHPRLAKQLTDPRFASAVQKFQTNPHQAMQDYKDDTEVQQFLKDFSALLGDHFSTMGGSSPPSFPSSVPPPQGTIRTHDSPNGADIKVKSSTNPKQATAEDEAKMQQILSDPEIREIMMDKKIQRLMEALRNNLDQGQRILQSADPEMRAKIQKLVDAGLLGFAP
ncbi:uncharacterized protein LOC119730362 [Patiria miniata]|uniref:STI1/HOP DP domain-containing protein n=1 Tax=Patiria miniata TaxID=46514 RepID=A0A914A5Y0_PATMI|nr:uncharacterized protein LOC119730362 [Patiria miniata]